jgi:hypothetical protein
MGVIARLWGRLSAAWAPRALLIENSRVVPRRATWVEIERTIWGYFPGDDWLYFDLRIGNIDAGKYMIVSSKTRPADLFAVLVTFDGRTFYSPEAESGVGTYAIGASEVYPDARCVTPQTAFAVGRTFCERGELDAAYRWRAFEGTGYVTAQTPRALRDDAEIIRAHELLRELTKSAQGSLEAIRLEAELRSLNHAPNETAPDAEPVSVFDVKRPEPFSGPTPDRPG